MFDLKIRYQLRRLKNNFFLSRNASQSELISKTDESKKEDLSKKIILKFFADLKEIVGDSPVLFLLDGERSSIYEGRKYRSWYYQANMYRFFKNHCCEYSNFNIIDLHNSFLENFEANKKFFNFEKDYHWNELGHKVAADAVIDSSFLDR